MTHDQLKDAIVNSRGRIFRVRFVKRTTGEQRTMVARTGVRAWRRGGELAFDPEKKGLLIVADMQKKGYRSIPWNDVTSFKMGGEEEEVKE